MTTQNSFDNQNPPLAQPSPQIPLTPPTSPAPYVSPPRESSWPTALGIIGVILGAFYILVVLGQVASMFMLFVFTRRTAETPEWAMMQLPLPWQVLSTIISLALAILILVCGAQLLKRRRSAAWGLIIWAIAYTLLAITNLTLSYTVMNNTMQKARQDVNGGMPAGIAADITFISMCAGGLFSLIPPVFVLIWFSRRKIKDEVAMWS